MNKNLLSLLKQQPLRSQLISHPFLKKMRSNKLLSQQVIVILAQWYHPLHHFPVFLSQLISILPTLSMQTYISKILWQELGEGNPRRAHEDIYISSMVNLGFERDSFINILPLSATENLINGYKQSIQEGYLAALGFVFGTEVADLAMVSAIGYSIRALKNVKHIEWVDIHVQQEPDHVQSVDCTLEEQLFTLSDKQQIVNNAAEMWQLWINFFNSLEKEISQEEGSVCTLKQLAI